MSVTSTPTVTTSTRYGIPNPTSDPSQNPNGDPYSSGPSVYLYGFLATLVLIFLVSIGVAWKGYRARRLLRARIDEAIARGVLVPGYDPSNPNLPLFPTSNTLGSRWRDAVPLERPVLYEEWIGGKAVLGVGEGEGDVGMWVIKPTALDALRPYDPTPPPLNTPRRSHTHSLFNQLLDPLRQYWFVQPPEGANANQLQGRPGRRGRTDTLHRIEEERMEGGMGLSGVREVVASVFIAMPDRLHSKWGVRGTAAAGGGRNAIASGSRPSSWQQPGIASGSRPTSLSISAHVHAAHAISNVLEERKELPELVLGVVLLGLKEEPSEVVETQEVEVEAEGGEGKRSEKGKEGKGKEPVTTPL